MRTISHRELRNNSSQILRDVSRGEIIHVTNHGEVAAVLIPPSLTSYERLLAAAKIRLPSADKSIDVHRLDRAKSYRTTREMIDDLRGNR